MTAMLPAFRYEDSSSEPVDMISAKGFEPSWGRLQFVSFKVFVVLLTICIFLVMVFGAFGYILLDIWMNSNFPKIYAKSLVVIALLIVVSEIVIHSIETWVKFWYINKTYWEAYSYYKENTEELSEENIAFIEDEAAKRSRVFWKR